MLLDNVIKKDLNNDFRKIILSIIRKMFSIKDELFSRRKKIIYVDMNSVMSILFNYDKINDKELIQDITHIFEDFIDTCIRSSSHVKFIYTSQPSIVHKTVYTNWCSKRYDRVCLKNSDFILNFLTAMKFFSENNKLIEVCNIGDKHITQFIVEDVTFNNNLLYVISKDFVCQSLLLEITDCIIYTGVNYIDYRDTNPTLYNVDNLKDIAPPGLYWVFPVICGDSRNEFKGYGGYSIKKTLKYIQENKIKLAIGGDHPLKDFIDEYKYLYNIREMIKKYKEIKGE